MPASGRNLSLKALNSSHQQLDGIKISLLLRKALSINIIDSMINNCAALDFSELQRFPRRQFLADLINNRGGLTFNFFKEIALTILLVAHITGIALGHQHRNSKLFLQQSADFAEQISAEIHEIRSENRTVMRQGTIQSA